MALHALEAERHDCGHPHSVCSDPDKDWFPQRTVCYPTMERMAAVARYERLHEDLPYHDGTFSSWRKKPDDEHPYHFQWGVSVWVAEKDWSPDDDFLSNT